MGTTGWFVTAAVVLVAVIGAASVAVGNHRRRQVRDLFGPDERPADVRALGGVGPGGLAGPGPADSTGSMALPPGEPGDPGGDQPHLGAEEVERYRERWDRVQAGFVDRPALALHEADTLVSAVMVELGFPVERLDQPADGPDGEASTTLQRYRAVQRVNLRADASETTTDELRQAFVQYRHLLDDLLGAEVRS